MAKNSRNVAIKPNYHVLSLREDAKRLRGLKSANGVGNWLGYRLFRSLVLLVSKPFLKGRIVGLELLPQPSPKYYPKFYRRYRSLKVSDTPFVIAPNHSHVLDIPLTGMIRRPMAWPSKPSFVKWWWLKQINQRVGCVPFMRDVDWAKNLEYAKITYTKDEVKDVLHKALRRGQPVVLYPQGTRREDASLEEAKLGAVYAAMRAGVPLVPLAIYGLTKGDDARRTPILHRYRAVAVVMPAILPWTYRDAASESERAQEIFTDWKRAIGDGRKTAQQVLASL